MILLKAVVAFHKLQMLYVCGKLTENLFFWHIIYILLWHGSEM